MRRKIAGRDKSDAFLLESQGQGEDTLCSEEFPVGVNAKTLLAEWRRACENIYRHASLLYSCSSFGNAVTYVISDSRCNEHITSEGCVERPVRLPAALKGARLAGANAGSNIEFLLSVGDDYVTIAEMKAIGMAHSSSYLKRMRLSALPSNLGKHGVPLTVTVTLKAGKILVSYQEPYICLLNSLLNNALPSFYLRGFSWVIHCGGSWSCSCD